MHISSIRNCAAEKLYTPSTWAPDAAVFLGNIYPLTTFFFLLWYFCWKKFRGVSPHISRETRESILAMFFCVLAPFSSNLKWKTSTGSIWLIKILLRKMVSLFSLLQNILSALISPIKEKPWGKWLSKAVIYIAGCTSVQFSSATESCLTLWPYEPQHTRPPCPSPTPRVYTNSCPLSWWCHLAISSFVVPFSSRLQSFPASGSFPMSQFFTSGGQNIGVSASASDLLMDIQDWFPLGWTSWISM